MKKLRMRVAATSLLLLFAVTNMQASAHAAVPKCTLAPERSLRFDPPKSDKAIQSFDYGPDGDVYFLQRSVKDTRLSRCSRTAKGKCVQRDSVRLPGYGHGESLEVFTENGRTYAWLGSGAGKSPPRYHSKKISLIEYVKAPSGSKKASYRRVGTLTGLAAVVPGKSGQAVRASVALADGQDRLAIRVQVGGPHSASYYGIYEAAALTALMKKAPGRKLSIAKAKKLLVSEFREPKASKKAFQGFDISDDGGDSKQLYVFRGYRGQTPTVYRYSWQDGGEVAKEHTYVLRDKHIKGYEAEGIKIEADPTSGGDVRVQVGFKPTHRDSEGRRVFRLYRLSEYANGLIVSAAVSSGPSTSKKGGSSKALAPCSAGDSPGKEKPSPLSQVTPPRASNLSTSERRGEQGPLEWHRWAISILR